MDVTGSSPDAVVDAALDAPDLPAETGEDAAPDTVLDLVADVTAGQDALAPAEDATAADAPDTDVMTDVSVDVPVAAKPSPLLAKGKFTDVSALLGLPWPVDPGVKGKATPFSSTALIDDVDEDGDLDLVVTDGLQQVWLMEGLATPWKFKTSLILTTPQKGLNALALWKDGSAAMPMLLVGGSHLHLLVWNKNLAKYEDKAYERGLTTPFNIMIQAIMPADVDHDGLLDLLVTIFTCGPQSQLLAYVAQGDGTFVERATELGIAQESSLWNVLPTDVDGDRKLDLLTLSESCDPHGGNAYFHAKPWDAPGKAFELKKLPPVFVAPEEKGSPMGGGIADFDGDGLLDLVLTEVGLRDLRLKGGDPKNAPVGVLEQYADSSNKLLLRQKDGSFVNVASQWGLVQAMSETGLTMVSWSARPLDFDHDGHVDLLMTHGYDYDSFLLSDEGGTRPVLFRNLGIGQFEDVSPKFGLPAVMPGRALLTADLDGDADLDFFLGGQTVQPRLYRNDVEHGGKGLTVRLKGTVSNPWGLGAKVVLQTSKRKLVAEATTHAPAHGMDLPWVHFALLSGEVAQSLQIAWPSGHDADHFLTGKDTHLVVEEPALVQLTARHVVASVDTQVTVMVRPFDPEGKPLAGSDGTSIELAPGSPGSWAGPLQCQPNGQCTRAWKPPVQGKGEAAIVVHLLGKPVAIRPRIRYVQPKSTP